MTDRNKKGQFVKGHIIEKYDFVENLDYFIVAKIGDGVKKRAERTIKTANINLIKNN